MNIIDYISRYNGLIDLKFGISVEDTDSKLNPVMESSLLSRIWRNRPLNEGQVEVNQGKRKTGQFLDDTLPKLDGINWARSKKFRGFRIWKVNKLLHRRKSEKSTIFNLYFERGVKSGPNFSFSD